MKILKRLFCVLFIISTFIMCAANDYVDVSDNLNIKIDGQYDEDWKNADFIHCDMKDVSGSQDKYSIIGFIADENNLYIMIFVMDDMLFEFNKMYDGIDITINESDVSRNFIVQSSGNYSGSNCDCAVEKDGNSYTIEMKIPFSKKINSQTNLAIIYNVGDNYIDDVEKIEKAEITESRIYLDFQETQQITTSSQNSQTTQATITTDDKNNETTKSNSIDKSEKTTTKKSSLTTKFYNSAMEKTTEITDKTIQNTSTTTIEEYSKVVFKENTTYQTLVFNEQAGSNDMATKIIGIIIAVTLILVGVILIMKFK